jgi:hypothetical protein
VVSPTSPPPESKDHPTLPRTTAVAHVSAVSKAFAESENAESASVSPIRGNADSPPSSCIRPVPRAPPGPFRTPSLTTSIFRRHGNGGLPDFHYVALFEPENQQRAAAAAERDEWTEAGAGERRGCTLERLLAEWDEVEDAMDESVAAVLVDLSVHFDDIREVFEGRTSRSGEDIVNSLARVHELQALRLEAFGAAPVNLLCTDSGERLTHDEASATVTGDTYDLFRTTESRRTREEADRFLDWGDVDEATRDLFAMFAWPT